tara:strand:- start:38 stop:223 length:186 start_codon:yes stop_codon:yes gene_type:complete
MSRPIDILQAIKSLDADAKVFVSDVLDIDNATIEWHDGTTEISKADIKAEMERLQNIEDNK